MTDLNDDYKVEQPRPIPGSGFSTPAEARKFLLHTVFFVAGNACLSIGLVGGFIAVAGKSLPVEAAQPACPVTKLTL